ncbi:hypothetical protein AGDE_12123 [Angomonas deanei]|nr:hypothetical protein AGDE_12123 [Angomonas deanei]|eukprot:EPY24885.1 hypothetical protein AGDE_12123 [Angomonas deanei]
MVEEAKAARASRKGGAAPPAAAAAATTSSAKKERSAEKAAKPANSNSTSHVDPEGEDMVAKYTGVSAEERDSIDKFIEQILNAPPMKIDDRLRENPTLDRQEDNTELLLTQRNQGKIAVYCQEGNQSGTKLVHATPTMSFEEFSSIVEKKFGKKMALSFYEDDDIIEMDDDDVFAMFLEMCQGPGGKKHKLICTDPDSKPKVHEDNITEEKPVENVKAAEDKAAKAFSNGELLVKEEKSYTGHAAAVYCCAFSPDGFSFVSASRDKTVRVWDTQKGTCSVMKGGHNDYVLSCDFSPKGNRCCSSSVDKTIKVWNVTTCSKVATLKAHDDKVYCVQYNPTGEYIVSGSCDHTLRVWNSESCSKIVTLRGHTLAVFSCGFSKTNGSKYVVSGSDDRLIKIWDWKAGKEVNSLVGHTGTVWSVCFSNNDDYIVSASMDHELKLWDAKTGLCTRTLLGHKVPTHNALFSADDKYIFSCARDNSVMVWRVEDGERVETITGHKDTVYHIELMENKLLTASMDKTLKLYNIGRQ